MPFFPYCATVPSTDVPIGTPHSDDAHHKFYLIRAHASRLHPIYAPMHAAPYINDCDCVA